MKLGHNVDIFALHPSFDDLAQKSFSDHDVHIQYVAPMHVKKEGDIKSYYSSTQLIAITLRATWHLCRAAIRNKADLVHIGKPHPMIDGSLRAGRVRTESMDPEMAILFLDFVLGHNASFDPVGELLDTIIEARQAAHLRGGHLTVVASMCGTADDLQDLDLQSRMLREQGVYVFNTNARAALFCTRLLSENGG